MKLTAILRLYFVIPHKVWKESVKVFYSLFPLLFQSRMTLIYFNKYMFLYNRCKSGSANENNNLVWKKSMQNRSSCLKSCFCSRGSPAYLKRLFFHIASLYFESPSLVIDNIEEMKLPFATESKITRIHFATSITTRQFISFINLCLMKCKSNRMDILILGKVKSHMDNWILEKHLFFNF